LQIAERDGVPGDEHCKGIPQLLRDPNPYACDPNAWRRVDVPPILRA
jgi:hypothetical protein